MCSSDLTFDARPARLVIAHDVTQRRLAEDALRASEQRLRTLMDGIPDHVWLKDTRGRFLAINRSYATARGVTETEIIGKSEFDLRPELAPVLAAEERSAVDAFRPKFQERRSHLDGKWREFIKLPIRGEDGTVTGLLSIARDITERRLRERDRHFFHRGLGQQHAVVPVRAVDRHGQVCARRSVGLGPEQDKIGRAHV